MAKTFKGFRLYAEDCNDFDLPDTKRIRHEFNVKVNFLKKNPAQTKFSSIMDVLNGYLLNGINGDFRQGEKGLIHHNISNIIDLVDFRKSIFIFDRGYVGMELYARLIELNTYYVVRLDDSYKKERDKINSNDSPIKLHLTAKRLKRFHNPILKEKIQ